MSSIFRKSVERNSQRMSITGTQGWMWLRTKNNDKGICNRAPLSSNYGTFVILMRSTDPATAGPKYLVTSRLLLEDEAMVFHAPLVATWSSNACHTHINMNHALTKQRSCRLAKEKQELTRGGYSHVISTFSIFFVVPKSKIMSTAELGSNPEAQYDCAFPSTALVAECCALEDVADLSQLLHSPFPGAYSKGLHHLPTPTILTHLLGSLSKKCLPRAQKLII